MISESDSSERYWKHKDNYRIWFKTEAKTRENRNRQIFVVALHVKGSKIKVNRSSCQCKTVYKCHVACVIVRCRSH